MKYRGLGYRRPFQGGVLALAMFALAGIPPTAGFMGKFFIFTAALREGESALAVIGILSAVVSVFYYLRVVVTLYMRPAETETSVGGGTLPETVTLAAAAFILLALGVFPAPLMDLLVSFFHDVMLPTDQNARICNQYPRNKQIWSTLRLLWMFILVNVRSSK